MHQHSCLLRGAAALTLAMALACSGGEPEVEEPIAADNNAAAAGNDAVEETKAPESESARDAPLTEEEKLNAAIADALNGKPAPAAAATAPASPPESSNPPVSLAPGENAIFETLWVHEKGATARQAPDQSATHAGVLPWGKKLHAVAAVNGFVRLDDGRYVQRKDLTDRKSRWFPKKGKPLVTDDGAMMSAKIGSTGSSVKAAGVTFVVTTNLLNVRNKPSLSGAVVDKLSEGTRVMGKVSTMGWIEIGEGRYLSAQYVMEAPTISH